MAKYSLKQVNPFRVSTSPINYVQNRNEAALRSIEYDAALRRAESEAKFQNEINRQLTENSRIEHEKQRRLMYDAGLLYDANGGYRTGLEVNPRIVYNPSHIDMLRRNIPQINRAVNAVGNYLRPYMIY